jgi:hypothetical protein
MPTIRVLKPFVFSTPVKEGTNGPAVEKVFNKGDHDISDEMWEHPWIRDTLAEGRIESPKQTLARAQKELELAQQTKKTADEATNQANAAFARLQASVPTNNATKEEIEKELNTPVNQLRKKGAMAQPGAIK